MQVAGEAGQEPSAVQMSLRVVPLFETLADLQSAGDTLHTLFSVPWYRKYLRYAHGYILLGTSDCQSSFLWQLSSKQRTAPDCALTPNLYRA